MIKMLLHAIDLPLAQGSAPAPAGSGQSGTFMIVFWGLFIAAMWFLLIAPQRKKQKDQQKMISAIAPGDRVLTAGGIYGEVTSVRPDCLVVRIGDNTKVELEKGFVQSVVRKSGEAAAPKK